MPDATDVSRARTELYDALRASAALAPWRVHRVTPRQIAAPTIFLDSAELGADTLNGVGFVAVTFPVVLVHDGAVRAQVEALDDMLAHVWTAALEASTNPVDSRPVAMDVGGPTLRAHIVRVGVTLQAYTMCAPSLISTGGTAHA